MKSVVIISTIDLYYGNTAAVARINLYAKALALSNVNVYLLSFSSFDENKVWIEVEPYIFVLSKDFQTKKTFFRPFFQFKQVRKIRRCISEIKGEVSILNYPSTTSLFLDIILLILCRKYPLYCEVNEVRRFASESKKTVKYYLYCFILERLYKYYNGLIFISKHIQDYYFKNTKKSIIIPILSDCSNKFRISSKLDSLDFVFVGTISFPKENLEELLEGFLIFMRKHPSARLFLYGSLLNIDKRRLQYYLSRSEAFNHIMYQGTISHKKVTHVLSAAGALLLPRANNKQNYYGFSTKLSEYAVSGTPVILTNTGVVADFFSDRDNCLICNGYNRESFNEKFEELAKMSFLEKKELTEKAYLVAKHNFDYRLYSNSLQDFLFDN